MSNLDVRAFTLLGVCVFRRKLRVRIATDRVFTGVDTETLEFFNCVMVILAHTEISKSRTELLFLLFLKGNGNKFHNSLCIAKET